MGTKGKIALDTLLEAEILKKYQSRITSDRHDLFLLNDRLVKKHLGFFLDHFDFRSKPIKFMSYYGFDGLNEDAVVELSHEFRTLEKKVATFLSDPSKKGNLNWFGGLFSNILVEGSNND